jgi:hypothetical protein
MDERACRDLEKRMDELELKFDQIMLQINRITFMCYGAVGFFILNQIGFIQAIKL